MPKLTPHEFVTRFRRVAGVNAESVYARLPDDQLGWLIDGEAWPLFEHWATVGGWPLDDVCRRDRLPVIECASCQEFTRPDNADRFCMKHLKSIPEKIFPIGCKNWSPA